MDNNSEYTIMFNNPRTYILNHLSADNFLLISKNNAVDFFFTDYITYLKNV